MDTDTPPSVNQPQEHLTRRERRLVRRQQQRQEQFSGRRSNLLRRVTIWSVSFAVIGGLGWFVFRAASNVQLPSTGGTLAVPVSASDHISGPASASITLVEYSDFQCPACGAFEPVVKQLLAEPDLKGKVRFVYRHFPLTQLHANAQLAAQASEAAALQGKFWGMHDKLFAGQTLWSGMSNAGAGQKFKTYAAELGLDAARFSRDIDSGQVKDKIKADADGGLAANVNATPTFFVNGAKMPSPQSYDQFKQYVVSGVR